jgi:hypothetical protein
MMRIFISWSGPLSKQVAEAPILPVLDGQVFVPVRSGSLREGHAER